MIPAWLLPAMFFAAAAGIVGGWVLREMLVPRETPPRTREQILSEWNLLMDAAVDDAERENRA